LKTTSCNGPRYCRSGRDSKNGHNPERDRDDSFAGRTHARNPLPPPAFAHYSINDIAIPRGLLSRTD
jgi:hypothetical protein